jgi:alkylation response protein AidB-like acyl-CoA dehydrogenase
MTATPAHHAERMHRGAKIPTIFEVTSEIQQLVIARAISGLRIEQSLGAKVWHFGMPDAP